MVPDALQTAVRKPISTNTTSMVLESFTPFHSIFPSWETGYLLYKV